MRLFVGANSEICGQHTDHVDTHLWYYMCPCPLEGLSMRINMKSLNSQLRKKGLKMVQEQIDPEFGPVYTIQSLKPGVSNTEVACRLYYEGEVRKWSAARRKAIIKASNRIKSIGETGGSLSE